MIDLFGKKKQKTIMVLKCKKSLYKSTYKKNAFTKNKKYDVVEIDDKFYHIVDNEGRALTVSKTEIPIYYYIGDYFIIND